MHGGKLTKLETVFRLGRVLGRGGFGVVFRAQSLSSGREAAVKISTQETMPGETERILREAKLLATLRHPRLVELFGVFQAEGGRLALAYELVDGRPLSDVCAAGPPNPEDALLWVEDVAAALDVLHGKGILHRDVKPPNVMVEPNGRARLLDYGLARPDEPGATVTATGIILGTPHFMAPEAISGERPDRAGDLYSLAAMAYWLHAGKVPFRGESPVEILKGQQEPPPSLMMFPEEQRGGLDAAFARALSPEPSQRPVSGGELALLLRRAHEEPVATQAGRHTPTRVLGERPPRTDTIASMAAFAQTPTPQRVMRKRRRFLLPLAVSTLLAMGLGWMLSGPDPKPPGPTEAVTREPARPRLDHPFGEDFGARVRDGLSDLPGRFVDRTGKDVGDARRARAGVFELTSGDPMLWPFIVRRIPELTLFMEWIGDGGDVRTLPRELVIELEKTDEYFRNQGLPRPFAPLLAARPLETPIPFPEGTRRFLQQRLPELELPERVGGWTGTAFQYLDRAHTGLERKYRIMQEDPSTAPDEFRSGFRVAGAMVGDTVGKILRGAWELDTARPGIESWLEPEIEAYQTGLLALGRALEEPGPERVRRILAVEVLIDKSIGYLLLGRLYDFAFPWLLGPAGVEPLKDPALAYLTFRMLRFRRFAFEDEFPEREAEIDEEIRRALEVEARAPRTGLSAKIWYQSCEERIRNLSQAGRYREALTIFEKARPPEHPIAQGAWLWMRVRTAVAVQRLGEPGPLGREQIRTVRAVLEDPEYLAYALKECRYRRVDDLALAQKSRGTTEGVRAAPDDGATLLRELERIEAEAGPR